MMKGILIYTNWFKHMNDEWTDEQSGKFIKSIGHWLETGELICDEPEVRGFLHAIKFSLEEMKDNYNTISERNRLNGKKGGRPKKIQNNPTKPTETHNNPMGFTETQDNPKNLIKNKNKKKNNKNNKNIEEEDINTNTDIIRYTGEKFGKLSHKEKYELYHKLKLKLVEIQVDEFSLTLEDFKLIHTDIIDEEDELHSIFN
jgi:hypothetical protein